MCCVLVAETAVFLDLHTIRVVLFFFHGVVVPLFAVLTCQGNFCAHLISLLTILAFQKKHLFSATDNITHILRLCQINFDN